MCHRFSTFFNEKIVKAKRRISEMRTQLDSNLQQIQIENNLTGSQFNSLAEVSVAEVSRLITRLPNKSSPLDYLHTSVLKSCSDVIAPLITHLANLSFAEGQFPSQFKVAQVTPLLKKEGLEASDPANYRPISNLNTISKVTERLCLARIVPHVASTGRYSPLT